MAHWRNTIAVHIDIASAHVLIDFQVAEGPKTRRELPPLHVLRPWYSPHFRQQDLGRSSNMQKDMEARCLCLAMLSTPSNLQAYIFLDIFGKDWIGLWTIISMSFRKNSYRMHLLLKRVSSGHVLGPQFANLRWNDLRGMKCWPDSVQLPILSLYLIILYSCSSRPTKIKERMHCCVHLNWFSHTKCPLTAYRVRICDGMVNQLYTYYIYRSNIYIYIYYINIYIYIQLYTYIYVYDRNSQEPLKPCSSSHTQIHTQTYTNCNQTRTRNNRFSS